MDDITEKLQEKQREVLVLLGTVNDLDKTLSRFRNELHEMYMENDKRLNEGERK